MKKGIFLLAAVLIAAAVPAGKGADKKPWKDKTVQVGDIKVHYIEAGAGNRHMVFVPGLMMTAEVWQEQIPYFAARGFHVIALDPRSHGSTTRTEEGNTFRQQAADLFAFLNALEIRHPILVGWSAAVVVLLEYVTSAETLQPEYLVLVDGSPGGQHDADYPFGPTLQQARTFLQNFQQDRAKSIDQYVRSLFKTRQPELRYKELIEGCMKTPVGTAVSLYFDLYSGDWRPALPRVEVPTLVMVREERRLLGEFLKSKIPRATLEVVADAGHAFFLEKPQTFNQILEQFVGPH